MVGNFYNAQGALDPAGAYARISTVLGIASAPELEAYRLRLAMERGIEAIAEDKQFYTERGTLIHDAAETFLKLGDEVELPETIDHFGTPKPCRALFDGFKNWVADYQPTNCLLEMALRSEKHQFAGRCDLICFIDGETWIIDYKTSKAHRDSHGLQLAAYRHAYYEMSGVWAKTAILRLEPKNKCGYAKPKEYDEPLEPFLGLLSYFRWQESKKPQRVTEASTWDGKSLLVGASA